MQTKLSIAIDGPSGSGKSTLARNLARQYGLIYIDTGALYRTVGLAAQRAGIADSDEAGIIALLPGLHITMSIQNGGNVVALDGCPIGDEIRTPLISRYASAVSRVPEVREFLLMLQKEIAKKGDCVMDGRDIGTVIMPDADVKIFLSAGNEDRAVRRHAELTAKGESVTLEQVRSDMAARDENDRNRTIAPAVPAPDAIMLDNSGFSPEQTLEAACRIIENTHREAGKAAPH